MVLASSVIRSAYQGESHGGVYLVDLQTGHFEVVIDWDNAEIDWSGRGGDRGLRGIAFYGNDIYLAASDEVFVYNPDFELKGSFRNAYLRHCHEIHIDGDDLYLTSTGFDSILRYDLRRQRFIEGIQLRFGPLAHLWERALTKASARALGEVIAPRPTVRRFDPEAAAGPAPGDTTHLNSVTVRGSALYVCGTRLRRLYAVRAGEIRGEIYARLPSHTHNARPFQDGVLMNSTADNEIRYVARDGSLRRGWRVTTPSPDALYNAHLAKGHARHTFGRGLAVWQDRCLIAGSSPATISVFSLDRGEPLVTVSLSMDVRNAIHGLEIWPFTPSLRPARQTMQ